jgi:hypothetical protein
VAGTRAADIVVDATKTYDIRLSVVFADDEPSAPVKRIPDPGDRRRVRKALLTAVGVRLAPLLDWLRRRFARRRPPGP